MSPVLTVTLPYVENTDGFAIVRMDSLLSMIGIGKGPK